MKFTIDLNGRFLCPFQLFIDLNSQLSNPLPHLDAKAFEPLCELNTINDWINLESHGKPTPLKAKVLCDLISEPLKKANQPIELDLLTVNGQITCDTLYALLFLAQNLPSLSLKFYVKKEAEELLRKQILPILETNKVEVAFKFEEPEAHLALKENRIKRLGNLGFCVDKLRSLETSQLIGYAWVCHKAGAYELATRALSYALEADNLPPALFETLFMQLQLVRFLSHQYESVAFAQYPEQFSFLKPEDAASLHFIKAYSATLTRHLSIAATHFKHCHVDEHMALTDENSLYRLNLYALFLALQDKAAISMQLELRIKDYILQHNINVVGLKYVNFINIARLYKKAQDFEQSQLYYASAYQEINCGYAPSDNIYYNMNLGSLCEAQGNYEKALSYWVKAAIHWLAYENKYALSWRPRLILCQEKITEVLKPLSIEKANHFLQQKIEQLLTTLGLQVAPSDANIQFKTDFTQKMDTCYVARGLVLYGTQECARVKPESRLNTLVSQLVKQFLTIDDRHQTLYIDKQNQFVPTDAQQSLNLATVANCNTCYYHGQLVEGQVSRVTVKLAPSIHSIIKTHLGWQLHYNRSFLNKLVKDADELKLMEQVEQEKAITLTQLNVLQKETLKCLIEKQVVMVSYPTTLTQTTPTEAFA